MGKKKYDDKKSYGKCYCWGYKKFDFDFDCKKETKKYDYKKHDKYNYHYKKEDKHKKCYHGYKKHDKHHGWEYKKYDKYYEKHHCCKKY
ncbi:hypothetical protein FS935_01655 [Metabacillus litoralis]|uniref:Uncharacterized protein n=1 Tax=Metabacillus litoralis TaxID=152268 RepID=A0A5C6W7K5_9BACI|nr:hypothetical protein [Metabacillus litoralis]TXC92925.1 hypothetical protein FS935_01655 [Metabacillus litoralis]